MAEGELIQSEATSILQEYTDLIPIKTKTAEFGRVSVYNDGSRLYELKGPRSLVVFLTPDGVEKMKSLPRRTVKRIHKSGNLGRGRTIDRGRSTIKEFSKLQVVQKTSRGGINNRERNRRLLELVGMRNLGRQIEKIRNQEGLRLEVPAYYGYASWETPTGNHRQALFMSPIDGERLNDIDFERAKEVYPDLKTVIDQAKEAGIKFKDLVGSNIFLKEGKEGEKTYIILDQA